MGRKRSGPAGHSGQAAGGTTRDVKVDRIGPVTVYKRGPTYYLYSREGGATQRRKVDGNLAVARATTSKVAAALAEHRPSPLGFQRATPRQMVDGYLRSITEVCKLALRTQDRSGPPSTGPSTSARTPAS